MRKSAGIVLYRYGKKELEVFLVHPGGPFWKKKDLGAWSVPKGEYEEGEDPLKAAMREFQEETGSIISGRFISLQPVKLKSGKVISAWAIEGDIDPSTVVSNVIPIQWPPGSGKMIEIPEVDKGDWFSIANARTKMNPGQIPLLDELVSKVQ